MTSESRMATGRLRSWIRAVTPDEIRVQTGLDLVDAIEREGHVDPLAQSGSSLDVERLFTALANVSGMQWDGIAIAAEYERLGKVD